jgi:glycosyltransferase involved in cell wall biosynthesis
MPREIVINGRFMTRRITGVERYGLEILRCIGNNSRVEKPTRALKGFAGHAWEQFILPGKLRHNSVLWSPANTGPLMVRNQILTIHDLSPLEHPEWFRFNFAAWYRLFLPMLARRVEHILVPSEYIKRKVMCRFQVKNVTLAPEGVDTSIFQPNARQNQFNLPERYVLFVGSLEPRKNLPLLLEAWAQIKDEFKDLTLVIAGESGGIFRNVTLPHNTERVRFLGYIPEAQLPGLYAGATLLVLPSIDEGFGLPALEAMACGLPVITSNGGALPEVVEDAGLIFPLADRTGLAKFIMRCLSDRVIYDHLREKGLERARLFSWERTSEIVWSVLNEN